MPKLPGDYGARLDFMPLARAVAAVHRIRPGSSFAENWADVVRVWCRHVDQDMQAILLDFLPDRALSRSLQKVLRHNDPEAVVWPHPEMASHELVEWQAAEAAGRRLGPIGGYERGPRRKQQPEHASDAEEEYQEAA